MQIPAYINSRYKRIYLAGGFCRSFATPFKLNLDYNYLSMSARLLFIVSLYLLISACSTKKVTETGPAPKSSILVFSKTVGFYHESIPNGIAALQQLGREAGIAVDTTKDAARFTAEGLKKYDAVVFLSTTQDVLNPEQQAAFEGYIRSGKGFVGIHAAADTEYDWPWYNKLVGAYFLSHPENQNARIQVLDKSHPSTKHLPDTWERYDEWYNYKSINPSINVLATLDEQSYKGGTNGANHPIAWYHEYDGGRAFYTGGGHTKESYAEPLFRQHLLGGIQYAIGK